MLKKEWLIFLEMPDAGKSDPYPDSEHWNSHTNEACMW